MMGNLGPEPPIFDGKTHGFPLDFPNKTNPLTYGFPMVFRFSYGFSGFPMVFPWIT